MRILALQDFPVAADALGLKIKQARGRKHLTQRELAALLEVDRKTIDNWENERTRPGVDKIAALEAVLGSLDRTPPADPREDELRRILTGVVPDSEVEQWIADYRTQRDKRRAG